MSITADIFDPVTREEYVRDPRHVAKMADKYLKSTGIGDTCYIGPEPEFFIFDEVRYEQTKNRGYYEIDSVVPNGWSAGFGDHTTGTGLMAIFNASTNDLSTVANCEEFASDAVGTAARR